MVGASQELIICCRSLVPERPLLIQLLHSPDKNVHVFRSKPRRYESYLNGKSKLQQREGVVSLLNSVRAIELLEQVNALEAVL